MFLQTRVCSFLLFFFFLFFFEARQRGSLFLYAAFLLFDSSVHTGKNI